MSTVEALIIALVSLSALCSILIYILLRLLNEWLYVRDELQCAADAEHAKCMAAVMGFVGDEFAAQVLAVAADDYESVENEADLARISRLRYKPGGPPVPAIWMRERSERLRVLSDLTRDEVSA